MIKKTLVSFLIALVAFGFTACDSDDNNVQLGVPDSAKPSKEFKVGNCDKEKYYGAQNEAYMSRSAEKWVRGLCFNELDVCG